MSNEFNYTSPNASWNFVSQNKAQKNWRPTEEHIAPAKKTGFSRFISWLDDLCFEKIDDERPIGISQLTHQAFQPNLRNQNSLFFRQASQADYRYTKLRQ